MIEFSCPHCGNRIKAQDAAAGKRGKCRHCGQTVEVPSLESPPPQSAAGDEGTPKEDTALQTTASHTAPQDTWKEWLEEFFGLNFETYRCPKCRTRNSTQETKCGNCGRVIIQTFLIQSLILTVLCPCLGPLSLGMALGTQILIARGALDRAEDAAFYARITFWLVVVSTVLIYVVYGLFFLFFAGL